MTLEEIIENSNLFTDEDLEDENYLSAANRAIALINTECKTKFPFHKNLNDVYTAIPKFWLYSLMSPYMSYAVKMNDSSLSEADRYLDEFYKALENFKDSLGALVESYKEDENGESDGNGISSDYINDVGFGGIYEIDTSNAINVGYFSNNGNAGGW